jgi:cyclophilin family peptidyl-prolyl cis-trans isomerase
MKLATLLLLGCGALALCPTEGNASSFVEFDYNVFGSRLRNTVFLELYDDRPITVANFLQYVNAGSYNNSMMHNLSISPGTLLGGGFYPSYLTEPAPNFVSLNPSAKVDLDNNAGTANPTIANEFNNVPLRSNVKGTIAMYHDSSVPGSLASNQFFLNLIDNSQFLDGSNGQTVFGHVTGDGMSLIDVYANQLPLINLNPDNDDNGTRDANYPSSSIPYPFLSVPILVNQANNTFVPLILNSAKSVDYLGTGTTTDVPAGGLTFSNSDVFIDTGTVFTGTGSVAIGVGRKLGMRENFVLNRDLLNHGTLAPGLSLGVVGVQGNYFQYSDGQLSVQLAGTAVDTQYDKLVASGTAFLAGRLQVQLLQGFTPIAGNTFNILSAQSIIGNFTSFDLPQLAAGLVWNINQTAIGVSLTVAAADFNKNGIVDAADYVYWRKTNGSASDYQLWRKSLGSRSGGVFAAGSSVDGSGLVNGTVPEPSAACLILIASMCRGSLRGRRLRA